MTSISIKLSDDAKRILAGISTLADRDAVLAGVAEVMDTQNEKTLAHIRVDRLSGKGPFDPALHKLGISKKNGGHLRAIAYRTEASISGNGVTSSIGAPVDYATIHEYGATWTSKGRKITKQVKGVRVVTGRKPGVQVVMPARSPFQTGIKSRADDYTNAISAMIVGLSRGGAS